MTKLPDLDIITVWVVEDDAIFRRNLLRGFKRSEELDCAADFASYEDMFEYAEEGHLWPDVVLMDIGLAGGSGLEGIRLLKEKASKVKTLVLTVFSNKEKLVDAMDAGASGYLLKRATMPEIVQGIRDVLDGDTVLDNKVIKYILTAAKEVKESDIKLAPREKEVLKLFSEGLSIAEASSEMDISMHTVDTYIRRIYKKMGVHSHSAAVARALREDLL